MRLKSLEMFGFKSFPERTRLEFNGGINAIVGPNGCGKSNVVDAIRWVLGETSAKSLRGKAMGDLIFNGSDKAAPMSLGEVTIHFENDDRTLNLDADEVALSRRVYRSGESNFYLNGKLVRQRDVHDLFADTGIGRAAYGVIKQGMIDRIVENKPEERREIFEEAAGVRRYRRRRSEAMAKLEEVHGNLERLEDLLEEYEKQARSLKRQASAARRYNSYIEEQRKIEVSLAFKEWDIIGEKYDRLKKELKRLSDAEKAARERQTGIEAEVAAIDAELENAELKRQELEDNRFDLAGKLSEADRRVEVIRERLTSSREKLTRLRADIEDKRGSEGKLRSKVVTGNRELSGLEALLQELSERITRSEETVNGNEARLGCLNADRSRKEKELLGAMESLTELRNKRANLAAVSDSLERDNLRLHQEAGKTSRLFDELSATKGSLTTDIEKTGAELQNAKRSISETTAEIVELDRRIEHAESEHKAAAEKISTQRSRLNTLTELVNRLESYEAGARDLLQNRPGLVRGVLAENISVRPGYELAVERALGAAAGALLADGLDAAGDCLNTLKERNVGRATFLVAGASGPQRLPLPDEAGVIGYLSDYIEVDGASADGILALLADTVLVEDLTVLKRLAPKLDCPLVTKDGDYWDGTAVLSGGQPGDPGATIVGRRGECSRLQSSLSDLQKRHDELERQLADDKKRRSELAQRRESLARTEERLATAQNAVRKELDEIAKRSGNLGQENEVIRKNVADITRQREENARSITEIDRQIEEGERRQEAIKQSGSALEHDIENAQTELDRARGELATLREQKATTAEKSASARREIEQSEKRIEENLARVREEEAEAERVTETINELEMGQNTALLAAVELKSAAGDIDGTVAAQKLLVEEGKARLREANERKRSRSNEGEELRADISQLEVDIAHIEGERGALDERIFASYKKRLRDFIRNEYTLETDEEEAQARRQTLANALSRMGQVNFLAADEYDEVTAKIEHITEQKDDLREAEKNLNESIHKIDEKSRERFVAVFEQARVNFAKRFTQVFDGGKADLVLEGDKDPLEAGVLIYAEPPGKKMELISLLSGGEKAMTAIALIFALLDIKPAPFCVLDEVDAPLDDTNIQRFLGLVYDNLDKTQFLLVTHVKKTMEAADIIYGVTMEEDGISKMLSLSLEDVPEEYPAAMAG
ncbi:MAG: chromosome segregation protein SMC [bacterium]|nr:chromosome segregation protein SMC [bacterium]